MKITSGSRRMTTPTTPIENSTADSAVYHVSGIIREARLGRRGAAEPFHRSPRPAAGLRLARRPTGVLRLALRKSPARQHEDADHRGQEQHGRELEREQVIGEEQAAERFDAAPGRDRRRLCGAAPGYRSE